MRFIYIYIYIYICVCVCVSAFKKAAESFVSPLQAGVKWNRQSFKPNPADNPNSKESTKIGRTFSARAVRCVVLSHINHRGQFKSEMQLPNSLYKTNKFDIQAKCMFHKTRST